LLAMDEKFRHASSVQSPPVTRAVKDHCRSLQTRHVAKGH
jgi:hypothetical protein